MPSVSRKLPAHIIGGGVCKALLTFTSTTDCHQKKRPRRVQSALLESRRMLLSSASRCVLECLKPAVSWGSDMVCATSGFGDNAETCVEQCRELSRSFLCLLLDVHRRRCERRRLSKIPIGARTGRCASCKRSPSHHVVTPQTCRSSVMSVRTDRRPKSEERMTDNFNELQTRSDMFLVLQATSC